MGISDVYWNYKMIKQVNGHWEFNLCDYAFAFPGILETYLRHVELSFVVIRQETQGLPTSVSHTGS